jgi:ABC transporter substrate binding protein
MRRRIERAIADFAQRPNGGLILTASQFGTNHPGPLAALAARHKLPAVYPFRYFASAGGLISYGPDQLDEYARAAAYVDRILKGEKPADLPVQAPIKLQAKIDAVLETKAADGPPATAEAMAGTSPQPTPNSLETVEERMGEISPQTVNAVRQAMARARAADDAGDKAECEQALADVRRTLGQ